MFPALGVGDASDSFSMPQFPFPHLATGRRQVELQGKVVLLASNGYNSAMPGQHLLGLIHLNPSNPELPTGHREQDPPAGEAVTSLNS